MRPLISCVLAHLCSSHSWPRPHHMLGQQDPFSVQGQWFPVSGQHPGALLPPKWDDFMYIPTVVVSNDKGHLSLLTNVSALINYNTEGFIFHDFSSYWISDHFSNVSKVCCIFMTSKFNLFCFFVCSLCDVLCGCEEQQFLYILCFPSLTCHIQHSKRLRWRISLQLTVHTLHMLA